MTDTFNLEMKPQIIDKEDIWSTIKLLAFCEQFSHNIAGLMYI